MPRGTTLAIARAMLKAEIGDYSGTNAESDAARNVLLSNMQKWLASEYDWPFLEHEWSANVAAAAQYVAIPTTEKRGISAAINFERGVLVERYFNQIYAEIDYGIGAAEYNTSSVERGTQTDPIQRWKFSTNTVEASLSNQFEVWPVPVTAQVVRFTGQRQLRTVSSDSDTLDLDDMLVVLMVAADMLARSNQADANAKGQKAARLLERLRQHYPVDEKTVVLGRMPDYRERRQLKAIMVA